MKKYILCGCLGAVLLMPAAGAAELNPLLRSSMPEPEMRVARVLAADRLLLENDQKIVLIGLKAPDDSGPVSAAARDEHGFIVPDDDPTMPLDVEAERFVASLVEGRAVRIEFDVSRRADYGLLQAYVFLPDGRLLNAEVLRHGYADLRLTPPNMKYADQLRASYQEARREMRGMQGIW